MNGVVTALLVGRDRQLAVLHDALARSVAGRGGLVMVSGEAGVGKTSLLAAALVATPELIVASGNGWDGDGVPGLWPWLQVVRGVQRSLPEAEWEASRAEAGAGLDRLLGSEGSAATEDGSFVVYDAVAALLVSVAQRHALAVVLDDLHWADAESIRLLAFLARQIALEPIAVIAAYRDEEVGADVRELESFATVIRLGGLDRDAIAALVAGSVGETLDAAAVDEMFTRTGGNPFFVHQTAQLWQATGASRGVAAGVRDVLQRRLARLPDASVAALSAAAVAGTQFEVAEVAAALGEPVAAIVSALAPAAHAGLVMDDSERGGVRFVHDLVRETLLGGLGDEERRRLHRGYFDSLRVRPGVAAARVAFHGYGALPDVDATVVADAARAAGRDAASRGAADEAAMQFGRVVELTASTDQWSEAAIELATAQRRAGQRAEAARTFTEVIAVARAADDGFALAHAVLGEHELGQELTEDVGEHVGRLREAEELIVATDVVGGDALRARLMAARSQSQSHTLGLDRAASERLSEEAVALARHADDDDALALCLLAHHDAIWQPGTAPERLALADEMAMVAARSGDVEAQLQAALLRAVALAEQGDPRCLDAFAGHAALAERSRLPRARYVARSRQGTIAMMRGEFAEARACIDDARAFGTRIGEVDAVSVWADQRWELARLSREWDDLDPVIAEVEATGGPHAFVFRRQIAVERGELDAARQRRDEMEKLGVEWPRWARLMWLNFQVQEAVALEDRVALARLRDEIAPLTDSWVVLGGAVIIRGPMAFSAGRVAATLGDSAAAVALFERARTSAAALGAAPFVAAAAAELAALAAARPSTSRGTFRRDGDVWTLGFDGVTVAVPDAKGLQDLHALISRAGVEIAAAELLTPSADAAEARAAKRVGADDVLDEAAKRAYRRRLDVLEQEIEAALARGTDERAVALEAERDALIAELRTAAGLGGRARRLGDESEKARKTVTARIRDSLRRLDERHPSLAAHLRSSVTTGSWCRYQPAAIVDWSL
jgi:hypothetical protein